MPYRTTSRFLRNVALPLLLATLAFASAPALAAERVTVPSPWRAGLTLAYDSETVHREGVGRERIVRRLTDRSEVRVDNVGRDGGLLTWTTRDSRVEAVEGDRVVSDMIASMMDGFDGYGVGLELDRDARYRRLHDTDAVTAKLRAVMAPAFEAYLERMLAQADPKLSKFQPETSPAQLRERVEAMLDDTLTPASVDGMTSAQIRPLTAFIGLPLAAGRTYRDREALRAQPEGFPVPARREYTLTIDRENPNLARIRWTHALDADGDAKALWALAESFGGDDADGDARSGRPRDLVLREQGVLVFRRDTGVVELLEVVTESRYGDRHDEYERMRMRLRGSARTWAQEEAARGP
jgi:hypothetical protein